jgi:hypothetical protein
MPSVSNPEREQNSTYEGKVNETVRFCGGGGKNRKEERSRKKNC